MHTPRGQSESQRWMVPVERPTPGGPKNGHLDAPTCASSCSEAERPILNASSRFEVTEVQCRFASFAKNPVKVNMHAQCASSPGSSCRVVAQSRVFGESLLSFWLSSPNLRRRCCPKSRLISSRLDL